MLGEGSVGWVQATHLKFSSFSCLCLENDVDNTYLNFFGFVQVNFVSSRASGFRAYSHGGGSHPTFPVVCLRGIPFNCTDIDIFKFFAGLDIIDALLVNKNGHSSGEAFVVFAGAMQAEFVLQRDRQNMGRRSIYKDQMEYTEIFQLRGLPFSVSKSEIFDSFDEFMLTDDRIHIACHPDGKATGEAYLEFASADKAKKAMCKDKMIGSRYVEQFPSTPDDARQDSCSIAGLGNKNMTKYGDSLSLEEKDVSILAYTCQTGTDCDWRPELSHYKAVLDDDAEEEDMSSIYKFTYPCPSSQRVQKPFFREEMSPQFLISGLDSFRRGHSASQSGNLVTWVFLRELCIPSVRLRHSLNYTQMIRSTVEICAKTSVFNMPLDLEKFTNSASRSVRLRQLLGGSLEGAV
ncbi:hypothetical protein HHK36_003177 [Tetracentron sinense]|uniref:RRM domain-containing protein n=1 Tax=Tetracentron sinense TaxID=13715 RepID=A0A834ZNL7_TETSI|nr:hypothetical protein HHK36_003177 [Tetracentron sinense]